jgi:hypothetical protein
VEILTYAIFLNSIEYQMVLLKIFCVCILGFVVLMLSIQPSYGQISRDKIMEVCTDMYMQMGASSDIATDQCILDLDYEQKSCINMMKALQGLDQNTAADQCNSQIEQKWNALQSGNFSGGPGIQSGPPQGPGGGIQSGP